MKLILQFTLFFSIQSYIFSQCTNSSLADFNNDDVLDVLDIVNIVDLIMENDSFSSSILISNDINQDSILDILDIVKLVNKILWPEPNPIEITSVELTLVDFIVFWQRSSSANFYAYKIYYSDQDLLNTRELIYETSNIEITQTDITGLSIYNEKWFWIDVIDHWGCNAISQSYKINNIEKNYDLDQTGNIIHSDMIIEDFESSASCIQCHADYVEEWSKSRHAHTMKDPLFFSQWQDEQNRHPETGERFCIQCHSPSAFVTGESLSGFQTVEDLQLSNVADQIKEGITCTMCHSVTGLSSTYFASDDLAPNAEYHLFPGEGVYFGSIENPEPSNYHDSEYSPIYERSEMCLPCHDLVMRDVEAEITFTEWNRIPGFAMFGGATCQNCHMPEKEDGTHDHSFVGVDLDLSYPLGEAPQHDAVKSMLEMAVQLEFGAPGYELVNTVNSGDSFIIPITITSLTAHNLPSGTSFSREAWVEAIVRQNEEIIFSSGKIDSNTSILNRQEESLLLFTSFFLDELGDTTMSITETYDIINETLPALGTRYHLYEVHLPSELTGNIDIEIRMRFRALTPLLLQGRHDDLLENQPVFDMANLNAQIQIVGD